MYKDKIVHTYTHYILYTKCLVTQSEDLEKDQELSQRCIWKSQICSFQSCTSRSVEEERRIIVVGIVVVVGHEKAWKSP